MAKKLVTSILVASFMVALSTPGAFAAANRIPTVTAFDVEANSASPVPVLTFTATDSDGTVAGYLITESDIKPAAVGPNWNLTRPATYTTSAVGPSVTLYAWAKDDRGGVSNYRMDTVSIPAPSISIDADTLDGKHAAEFAAAVHTHAQADVTDLAAALASKADASHDHDSLYQKKYANVVVVAKSGGDFVDPVAAVNSITDASSTNPYLVKIMPGVYSAGRIYGKSYVDIEGSGRYATTLLSGVEYGDVIDSEIRGLTIEITSVNPRSYVNAIAIRNSSPRISDVTMSIFGAAGGCVDMLVSGYGPVGTNPVFSDVECTATVMGNVGYPLYGIKGVGNPLLDNVRITLTSDDGATGVSLFTGVADISNSFIDAFSTAGGGVGILHGQASYPISTPSNGNLRIAGTRVRGSYASLVMDIFTKAGGVDISGDLQASGSQFDGSVLYNGNGNYKMVNCHNGVFDPIPNR